MSDELEQVRALQARLAARARQPRAADAVDLVIDGARCGFCRPAVAACVAAEVAGFDLGPAGLRLTAGNAATRSERLEAAARALHRAGLVLGWRDELLDVPDPGGDAPLARIERSACRTFAIETTAVHMNGWSTDGRLWVARRSGHKAIDPGLWDTLVGGMVAAGESDGVALRREAYEEAGLDLRDPLPAAAGEVRLERPVFEGFELETIRVFDLVLDDSVVPRNIDREVEAFALRPVADVLAAIAADEFTLEAALVHLDGIARRQARR